MLGSESYFCWGGSFSFQRVRRNSKGVTIDFHLISFVLQ
ncbi:hypothetical protein D593_1471 [Streptococcus intermedius BA1]|nr:hypothetical protein D593_1471 [Streptococcus intermedius BA1]